MLYSYLIVLLAVKSVYLEEMSSSPKDVSAVKLSQDLELDYATASKLAELPLHCIRTEYPNSPNNVQQDQSEVLPPSEIHPVFYGCFDWHSSVHGHWLLAKVGNLFPDSELFKKIQELFSSQFTVEKVETELRYFKRKWGKSFERTYGWAWLLKLQGELEFSEIPVFQEFATILKPLSDHIADLYVDFLPRLSYPVRVGEHTNSAFGFSFALDYARSSGNTKLENEIKNSSLSFYLSDVECPLRYEPSGYDFLSPCLQEADLMTRIIEESSDYSAWLSKFLPQIFADEFDLQPGQVLDRTDGKLVHLDGLNFSRAWNLYNIAYKIQDEKMRARLFKMADNHIFTSMDYVIGSDYAGSHWLASFLLHALEVRHRAEK